MMAAIFSSFLFWISIFQNLIEIRLDEFLEIRFDNGLFKLYYIVVQ